MINVSESWNAKQKNLRIYLSKQNTFDKGIQLLLDMHSLLHDRKVHNISGETYYHLLWENLKEEACKIISGRETSILWNIWHITRIEDLVSNILIGNKETVFNEKMQKKLKIEIKDTGNALVLSEIELLNKNICVKELKEYRTKVGKSTKRIIENITFNEIKRKVEKEQLDKIMLNGGVTKDPKSIWLLDFWARKNVLGLIMMPLTRHQVVHLNDCFKIKMKYNK